MSFKRIIKVASSLLFFLAVALVFPLIVSVIYLENDIKAFLNSILIILFISGICFLFTKGERSEINRKEAFIIATLAWVLFASFGALPYILSGSIKNVTDAVFESMSGFSTTGATILSSIEDLPHGILFWRSMSQWLGGMGIIVLSIAILPLLGVGGMELFKAEVPGPVKDKMTPRVKDTAKALWIIYLTFTLAEFVLLLFGGVSVYDSICHSFTTLATGGFSTKNLSIEHYNNYYIHFIFVVFMMIAGINFNLSYYAFKGDFKSFFKSSEFKLYMAIFISATLIITGNLYFTQGEHTGYNNFFLSFNQAIFQVSSILTTTGYSNVNWELWPYASQCILLLLFFVGGMAGSTAGGIKIIRHLTLWKHSYTQLQKIVHPHSIMSVKIEKKAVDRETLQSIWGFLFLFILSLCIGTLALTFMGIDIMTAFSSVATSLGNVGPGFNLVGPAENFGFMPDAAKWVLVFCMLIGRLEIYTVLVLFLPAFWQK